VDDALRLFVVPAISALLAFAASWGAVRAEMRFRGKVDELRERTAGERQAESNRRLATIEEALKGSSDKNVDLGRALERLEGLDRRLGSIEEDLRLIIRRDRHPHP
jgi:hypothetical protein